jgi:hypothetical protein
MRPKLTPLQKKHRIPPLDDDGFVLPSARPYAANWYRIRYQAATPSAATGAEVIRGHRPDLRVGKPIIINRNKTPVGVSFSIEALVAGLKQMGSHE